jgi:hypothetical protein
VLDRLGYRSTQVVSSLSVCIYIYKNWTLELGWHAHCFLSWACVCVQTHLCVGLARTIYINIYTVYTRSIYGIVGREMIKRTVFIYRVNKWCVSGIFGREITKYTVFLYGVNIWCISGIFGREITKYTVLIYGACKWFRPTLPMCTQELNTEGVLLRKGLLHKVDRIDVLRASHPHKRLFVLSAAYDVYSSLLDIRCLCPCCTLSAFSTLMHCWWSYEYFCCDLYQYAAYDVYSSLLDIRCLCPCCTLSAFSTLMHCWWSYEYCDLYQYKAYDVYSSLLDIRCLCPCCTLSAFSTLMHCWRSCQYFCCDMYL